MSETNLYDESFCLSSKKMDAACNKELVSTKEQLRAKYLSKFNCKNPINNESLNPTGNWCEALSSSLSSVNAKQAWKSGTGKLSQTLNNVRTTFGVLSQRIKKSTKKRQPLINMESPKSPVTPYTKSRAVLGRTPTKLYSPFSIDTPTGKENKPDRFVKDEIYSNNGTRSGGKTKLRKMRLDLDEKNHAKKGVLSNDLLQTQIGIYEFQSVANKIVQGDFNN